MKDNEWPLFFMPSSHCIHLLQSSSHFSFDSSLFYIKSIIAKLNSNFNLNYNLTPPHPTGKVRYNSKRVIWLHLQIKHLNLTPNLNLNLKPNLNKTWAWHNFSLSLFFTFLWPWKYLAHPIYLLNIGYTATVWTAIIQSFLGGSQR